MIPGQSLDGIIEKYIANLKHPAHKSYNLDYTQRKSFTVGNFSYCSRTRNSIKERPASVENTETYMILEFQYT